MIELDSPGAFPHFLLVSSQPGLWPRPEEGRLIFAWLYLFTYKHQCICRAFVLSVFFELAAEPGTDKALHNERKNKCGIQFDS